MKKTMRILIPVLLVFTIILFSAWYFLVYDQAFTRDLLLSCARYSEDNGNLNMASWFYNLAYANSKDNEAVAIELAEQYKENGNYTKAENVLANAIADGGSVELYVALCETYIEQDKLMDAVNMLESIANADIKAQIDKMRPEAPTPPKDLTTEATYNEYISIPLQVSVGTIYYSLDDQYPSLSATKYTAPIQTVEGVNRIRALAVHDGLVSKLVEYNYTVGGVIEPVIFADSVFEAEVRKALQVGQSKTLYTNDLWNIINFVIPADVLSYEDLHYLSYLESLTIMNGVSDQLHHVGALKESLKQLTITQTNISTENLQTISSFPRLTKLTLQNCDLTSISSLSNADKLIELDISNNTVRNLDALRSLTKLKKLNLSDNAVIDLSALSSLTAIQWLDVSENDLTTLAPLSKLSKLTYLNAYHNRINDLGNFDQLISLTHVNLGENELTDITKIGACLDIADLTIANNELVDISALSTLINLQFLDFSNNLVIALPTWPTDCALVQINGTNNLISNIDCLGGLRHLNIVGFDYNTELKNINALAICPNLIRVDVFGTKVSDVKTLQNMGVIVSYSEVG